MEPKNVLLVIVLVVIVSIGAFAYLYKTGVIDRTIIDETTHIEGGIVHGYTLKSGEYSVEIDSDDDLRIEWLGGAVGSWADAKDIRHYSRTIELTETGTLRIANPSGIFSNPTATVYVKVVKKG